MTYYYIADQYGSYLCFRTSIYPLACAIRYAWDQYGFESYVVSGDTGRAISEVGDIDPSIETFAQKYASELYSSNYESTICVSRSEVDNQVRALI